MKARLNTVMGQAQQELNSFGDEAIYGDTNQVLPFPPFLSMVLTVLSSNQAGSSSA